MRQEWDGIDRSENGTLAMTINHNLEILKNFVTLLIYPSNGYTKTSIHHMFCLNNLQITIGFSWKQVLIINWHGTWYRDGT